MPKWRNSPLARSASPLELKGNNMTNQKHEGTKVWHLALAWAWVGIPLAMGVIQTLINSMKLFQ
jgi:hypothetical protein